MILLFYLYFSLLFVFVVIFISNTFPPSPSLQSCEECAEEVACGWCERSSKCQPRSSASSCKEPFSTTCASKLSTWSLFFFIVTFLFLFAHILSSKPLVLLVTRRLAWLVATVCVSSASRTIAVKANTRIARNLSTRASLIPHLVKFFHSCFFFFSLSCLLLIIFLPSISSPLLHPHI